MSDEYRTGVCVGATVLVDGTGRGTWKLALAKQKATLTVPLFERLPRADHAEVTAEAPRLLTFAAAGSETRDLVWA